MLRNVEIMNEATPFLYHSTVYYFEELLNKKKLFEKTAELLSIDSEFTFPQVLDCINSRERLGSTYIANGVAIPHCKIAIESPKIIILVLGNKVKYSEDSQQQVDILFALLVPEENCEQHLHILSSIAKLCQQEDWIAGIRKLKSEQDIIKYIAETKNGLGDKP